MRLCLCFLGLFFFCKIQAQNLVDSLDNPPKLEVSAVCEYDFDYGCMNIPEKFIRHVQRNMQYPAQAIEKEIQGTVYIRATIGVKGKLKDIEIVKGYPYLNEEALKIVRNSPRWKPAKMNGKPVESKIIIPLRFLLADDKR